MKDLIVILIIISIIFGGNYLLNKHLIKSTSELLKVVNKMEESLDMSRNEKEKVVKTLLDIWEKHEKIWISLEYHQNINEIEDILIESYTFYLEGDKTHFLLNARKLNRNMDDLKNRERISLVNVL